MDDRLAQLRIELEKGQQELLRLGQRRQDVRDTMLRISGAIQVLEELRAKEVGPSAQPELAAANQ